MEEKQKVTMVSAPPRGMLFQEYLVTQPFWMMVACILVNLTTWEKARLVHSKLKRKFKDHNELAKVTPESLYGMLRALGLWRIRSKSLVKLATEWKKNPPKCADDIRKLPGCGKYAADSWSIFVDNNLDVKPDDGKLNWFMRRVKSNV